MSVAVNWAMSVSHSFSDRLVEVCNICAAQNKLIVFLTCVVLALSAINQVNQLLKSDPAKIVGDEPNPEPTAPEAVPEDADQGTSERWFCLAAGSTAFTADRKKIYHLDNCCYHIAGTLQHPIRLCKDCWKDGKRAMTDGDRVVLLDV